MKIIPLKYFKEACAPMRALVRMTWPKGVPVTLRALTKAIQLGLPVSWLERMLEGKTWLDYDAFSQAEASRYAEVVSPLIEKRRAQIAKATKIVLKAGKPGDLRDVPDQVWARCDRMIKRAREFFLQERKKAWDAYQQRLGVELLKLIRKLPERGIH